MQTKRSLFRSPSATLGLAAAPAVERIAIAQTTGHLDRALDDGVRPGEIAAIITHPAFHSGWQRAVSAVGVAQDVFAQRRLTPGQLAAGSGELLPIDEASEARRRRRGPGRQHRPSPCPAVSNSPA